MKITTITQARQYGKSGFPDEDMFHRYYADLIDIHDMDIAKEWAEKDDKIYPIAKKDIKSEIIRLAIIGESQPFKHEITTERFNIDSRVYLNNGDIINMWFDILSDSPTEDLIVYLEEL